MIHKNLFVADIGRVHDKLGGVEPTYNFRMRCKIEQSHTCMIHFFLSLFFFANTHATPFKKKKDYICN